MVVTWSILLSDHILLKKKEKKKISLASPPTFTRISTSWKRRAPPHFSTWSCPPLGLLFMRRSPHDEIYMMKNGGCDGISGQRTWSHVSEHRIWFTDGWFVVSEILVLPSLFSQDSVSEIVKHPSHCVAARNKDPGSSLPRSEFLSHRC